MSTFLLLFCPFCLRVAARKFAQAGAPAEVPFVWEGVAENSNFFKNFQMFRIIFQTFRPNFQTFSIVFERFQKKLARLMRKSLDFAAYGMA
jgi:hypothetical protein